MGRFTVLLMLVGLAAIVAFVGCGEKDVPFVVDADELTRYISETSIAKELFRVSGLINPDPYTVPFDSAVFYDSLIASQRSVEVFLVPLDRSNDEIYADYGGYIGRVRESVVSVADRFTIQISRVYSDTTKVDTTQLDLQRYGFFLKMGSDDRPYVGWVLWGFNGIGTAAPPVVVTMKAASGAEFRGDLALYPDEPQSNSMAIPDISYIRLTEMDTVVQGSRLLVSARKSSSSGLPTTQLISDYDPDGAFTRGLYRYDTIEFLDSLSYQTVTDNPRLYNLVFIQTLNSLSLSNRGGFVVPYRI